MKLFTCFSSEQIEHDHETPTRLPSHVSLWEKCMGLLQERLRQRRSSSPHQSRPPPRSQSYSHVPHAHHIPPRVGKQSSFESINDVTSRKRPRIFPESHQIHHSKSHPVIYSQHSYRVSPSFPPKLYDDEEDGYGHFYDDDPNKNKNNRNKMDIDAFLQEFNQDTEFIENIAREIMKAKRAIDEEIYQELQRRRP